MERYLGQARIHAARALRRRLRFVAALLPQGRPGVYVRALDAQAYLARRTPPWWVVRRKVRVALQLETALVVVLGASVQLGLSKGLRGVEALRPRRLGHRGLLRVREKSQDWSSTSIAALNQAQSFCSRVIGRNGERRGVWPYRSMQSQDCASVLIWYVCYWITEQLGT